MAIDLGWAAKLPPEQAIDYLRSKGLGVSWDWHDTWQAAHGRAFVVAKAAKLNVLSALREAVDAALAGGLTRREFMRQLEPQLRAMGWWGRRQVVRGPDGAEDEVQLGSPRRLKTIYDTNMRVAYNAGRYRSHEANVDSRPYWQYQSMDDARVRPSHRAMSGRVYRHDDPIWATHYPPNGFNCRCSVRALTERQVRSRNIAVYESGTGDGGVLSQTDQVVGVDRRTGEEIHRPATEYVFEAGGRPVFFTPDPGWNYNPGRTGAPFGPLTGDPERLSPLAGGQTTARQLGLPDLPPRPRPRAPPLPPASTAAAAERQIREAVDRETGGLAIVNTPVGDVALTDVFVRHVASRPERAQFVAQIVPTLRDPAEVWLQAVVMRDGRIAYRPIYVGEGNVVVAQEKADGTVGWTFYPERRLERRRAGYLLYSRAIRL